MLFPIRRSHLGRHTKSRESDSTRNGTIRSGSRSHDRSAQRASAGVVFEPTMMRREGVGAGGFEAAAEGFGGDVETSRLDVETADGVVGNVPAEVLFVGGGGVEHPVRGEEGGFDAGGAGQEGDSGDESGEAEGLGQAGEQSGAGEGRVGVENPGGEGGNGERGAEGNVSVGQGGARGERGGASVRGGERAEPDGGFAGLSGEGDYFDFEIIRRKMGLEIAGGAEFDGSAGCEGWERQEEFEAGGVVGDGAGSGTLEGAAVGVDVDECAGEGWGRTRRGPGGRGKGGGRCGFGRSRGFGEPCRGRDQQRSQGCGRRSRGRRNRCRSRGRRRGGRRRIGRPCGGRRARRWTVRGRWGRATSGKLGRIWTEPGAGRGSTGRRRRRPRRGGAFASGRGRRGGVRGSGRRRRGGSGRIRRRGRGIRRRWGACVRSWLVEGWGIG